MLGEPGYRRSRGSHSSFWDFQPWGDDEALGAELSRLDVCTQLQDWALGAAALIPALLDGAAPLCSVSH